MYTVPFLASRSLQPELSLSCMHVHCTFPYLQVASAWTVPVLHDWHPMYTFQVASAWTVSVLHDWHPMSTVPIRMHPCMFVQSASLYINFVWSSQACICKYLMVQLITNKFYMKQCFSRSHTQLSKLKQWNNHQQWFTIYNVRSMSTSWFYTANDQAVQTNASQMIQRE